jgi:predicted nucleic acid-binding protein
MSGKIFLDTNILVYSFDNSAPVKRERARALVRALLEKGHGSISWQVVQEFLNVARHKFEVPLSEGEASDYLDQVLRPLWKIFPSAELFQEALLIQRKSQYRFYDSLIVAAAVHAGASILYSEDLQHERVFGKTQIINPFLASAKD